MGATDATKPAPTHTHLPSGFWCCVSLHWEKQPRQPAGKDLVTPIAGRPPQPSASTLVSQVLLAQPAAHPNPRGPAASFPDGGKSDAKPPPSYGPRVCTHLQHTHRYTQAHTYAHTHQHAHTQTPAYLSMPLALGLTLHLLQDFICEEIFI